MHDDIIVAFLCYGREVSKYEHMILHNIRCRLAKGTLCQQDVAIMTGMWRRVCMKRGTTKT
jgi:hypothetical protein